MFSGAQKNGLIDTFHFFLTLYTARPSFEYYRQVFFVHSGLQEESLQVTISKLRRVLNIQGFSWTEIYFGHFVQAAPILLGHLEIF